MSKEEKKQSKKPHFFSEVKTEIRDNMAKAVANIVLKLITYTIPVFILTMLGNRLVNPPMDISDMNVEITGDKLVLSEENSAPNIKKEFVIEDEEAGSEIDLSSKYSYYAPELEISIKGKGIIKKAYLFYEQNEVDASDELIIQKASVEQNWYNTYFKVGKKKCSITCNYVNKANKSSKFIYVMIIGKDDTQDIFCIHIDMDTMEGEAMNIEDVYQLAPDSISIFGSNEKEIQQNVATILKMELN